MREVITLLVVQLIIFACCVGADLTLSGPKCGVLACRRDEHCSPVDNQCKSCVDVCDKQSHNFEERLCVDECQDYLHDIRYAPLGSSSANRGTADNTFNNSNSKEDIDKLYTLVTTTLTLLILLILCIVAYGVYKCYYWAKKNDINANNVLSYFKRECDDDVEKGTQNGISNNSSTVTPKRDLRLQISGPMSQSEAATVTTPATMTTSISRRPAEDSALDYAYDNHGMAAGTPSPHSAVKSPTPRESNF